MAGHKIAHAAWTGGPSVIKEIVLASVIGTAAGMMWKVYQWKKQIKVRGFYDLLDSGDIKVVAEE